MDGMTNTECTWNFPVEFQELSYSKDINLFDVPASLGRVLSVFAGVRGASPSQGVAECAVRRDGAHGAGLEDGVLGLPADPGSLRRRGGEAVEQPLVRLRERRARLLARRVEHRPVDEHHAHV